MFDFATQIDNVSGQKVLLIDSFLVLIPYKNSNKPVHDEE